MAIPVYMFAGFLESGKTSFIASVLQDPGFTRDESTLIIQCEEGETEYEPDMLKKTHSVVECIEDEDEYNGDTLRAFVRKHHPDRVIVEMNGMWDLDAAIERTPKVLEIYQIITTVNAETFDLYAKNMGQRMLQHITDADMVVFNRATEETRQLIRDRNVRSMNPQASLYFENDDGTSEDYGAGMPPPYDMDAPIVEIEDHQLASSIWTLPKTRRNTTERPCGLRAISTAAATSARTSLFPAGWAWSAARRTCASSALSPRRTGCRCPSRRRGRW